MQAGRGCWEDKREFDHLFFIFFACVMVGRHPVKAICSIPRWRSLLAAQVPEGRGWKCGADDSPRVVVAWEETQLSDVQGSVWCSCRRCKGLARLVLTSRNSAACDEYDGRCSPAVRISLKEVLSKLLCRQRRVSSVPIGPISPVLFALSSQPTPPEHSHHLRLNSSTPQLAECLASLN